MTTTITFGVTGLVGVEPGVGFIKTSDTNAAVTTAGWLNGKSEGISIPNNALAAITTSDEGSKWYQVNIAPTGVITLVAV